MRCMEIADKIAELKLKKLNATPSYSVAAIITPLLGADGGKAIFRRVAKGLYTLAEVGDAPQVGGSAAAPPAADQTAMADLKEAGLINAFGMYWSRALVLWTSTPQMLGQQQIGSVPVDFCQQRGVYLLHDGREVVYVGRTTDQPIGIRLRQHTKDRLNGRWDRFSWFGVHDVNEAGHLVTTDTVTFGVDMLIATMEALLIEGLEPRQNKKSGDDFRAAEYLQVEDPSIQKSQGLKFLDELKRKL